MKKRLPQEEINIALAGGVPEGRTKAWAAGLRRRLKAKAEKESKKKDTGKAEASPEPETQTPADEEPVPEVHAAEVPAAPEGEVPCALDAHPVQDSVVIEQD